MPPSKVFDVDALRSLEVARYDHRRIWLQPNPRVLGRDLLRGNYGGVVPIPAVIGEEGPAGDLIGTGWANVYVMTSRFESSLNALELTGWNAIPIEVTGSNAEGGGFQFWH